MTNPAVEFKCREIAHSYFYEMAIRLGDHCEEVGGSRVFLGPEDALMRAALLLVAGGWEAEARFPAENDDHTMTLRMFNPQDGAPRDRLEYPCELIWSEVDPHPHPIETRSLGIAPSTLQLVDAIFRFGEAHYAGREPSAALIALRSALPAIKLEWPAF